jgi:uncharacterized protein YjcR
MGKRGAPKGNRNAVTHGFYARALSEAEELAYDEACSMEGLDHEIAVLRIRLRSLIESYPDRWDLQLQAASTIARPVRARYQITHDQKKSLKDAIAHVLEEVAAPLGVGLGMGAGMRLK